MASASPRRRWWRSRWSRRLERLGGDEEYEGLFPHGAPVIAEGHVFVLARKFSGQMLTGCYLVALDLATGNLAWIRHVASSGSKAPNARPFGTLVYRDGQTMIEVAPGSVQALGGVAPEPPPVERLGRITLRGEARDRATANALRERLVADELYVTETGGTETDGGQRLPHEFLYTLETEATTPSDGDGITGSDEAVARGEDQP